MQNFSLIPQNGCKSKYLGSCDGDLRETGTSKVKSPEKKVVGILIQVRKEVPNSDTINFFKKEIDLHFYFVIEEIGSTQQNTA